MWQHKLWNMRQFTRTEIYKRYIVPSPAMMLVHRVTTFAASKGLRTLGFGNRSLDSALPCCRPLPVSYRYRCTIIHVDRNLGASVANCGSRAPLSSASTISHRLPPRILHHTQLLYLMNLHGVVSSTIVIKRTINPTARMPEHGSQPEGTYHLQGRK